MAHWRTLLLLSLISLAQDYYVIGGMHGMVIARVGLITELVIIIIITITRAP